MKPRTAVIPASTGIVAPCTCEASSLARNTATAATSAAPVLTGWSAVAALAFVFLPTTIALGGALRTGLRPSRRAPARSPR